MNQLRAGVGGDARTARWWRVVLFVIVTITLAAPWIAPFDPNQLLGVIELRSRLPSLQHPFGTDSYSRDLLSRVLVGARESMLLATGAVIVSTVVGTIVGVLAGYASRTIDAAITRLVDVGLAIPRVLLLLVIIAFTGSPGMVTLAVILGLTGWMSLARLLRGEIRRLRSAERIAAARAMGLAPFTIARRHMLPDLAALIAVSATLGFGQLLLLESGLSFLGFGVQPPTPSWGTVLLDVSDVMGPSRWLMLGPGLALVFTVTVVFKVGDGLFEARKP